MPNNNKKDTYTVQLKRDILQNKTFRSEYKNQLLCGLVYYIQRYEPSEIRLTTREKQVARFFSDIIHDVINLQGTVTISKTLEPMLTYNVTLDDMIDRINLLNYFSMLYPEGVTFDLLGGEGGTAAFLAGVFLSCGSFSDPEKSYSLEFAPSNGEKFDQLYDMLNEVGFFPHINERRGVKFIYFHDSEQIENLLVFLGCTTLSMELMNTKILKEIRNSANRLSNCDTANIEKTVKASTEQIEAIKLLFDAIGEEKLPNNLCEIAKLRLENPEMSLRELGEICNPPISRSGVNHRLEKIIRLSKEYK